MGSTHQLNETSPDYDGFSSTEINTGREHFRRFSYHLSQSSIDELSFSPEPALCSTMAASSVSHSLRQVLNSNNSNSNISNSFHYEEPSIPEPVYAQPLPSNNDISMEILDNCETMNISFGTVEPYLDLSKGTTIRGKDKFFLQPYGYEYVYGYESFTKVDGKKVKSFMYKYFRCKNHQEGSIMCKAKIRVPYDYWNSTRETWSFWPVNTPKDGGHTANCLCQVGKQKADELIRACKDEATKQPLKEAKTILDEKRLEMINDNTSTEFFPSDERIIKQINHARKDQRIHPPRNFEDLLSHQVSLNAPGFTDFYRADVKVRNKRHFIFYTNNQLQKLRRVKHIKIDGTFKIVMSPLYQLLSIHGYGITADQKKQNIPLCFVAMSGKRAIDYEAVFRELKNHMESDEQPIQLEEVLIDFEAAIWKALGQVFGSSLKIKGCWFHFNQCLFKKI